MGEDCLLSHVIGIRRTTMLKDTSREIQVRVVDVPPGMFVGDQAVDYILGVGDAPKDRVRGQCVL